MYDGRTNLSLQVEEEVRRVFGERVFRSVISRSVRIGEASSYGKPIIFYDFRSKGASNYIDLCQEVLHVLEKTSIGQGGLIRFLRRAVPPPSALLFSRPTNRRN